MVAQSQDKRERQWEFKAYRLLPERRSRLSILCEILNIKKNIQENMSCNVNVPKGIMGSTVKLNILL
jgi:hypothetical protein